MKKRSGNFTVFMVITFLTILVIGVIGSYNFGIQSVMEGSIKQFILTDNVEVGHSLQGKYKEISVPKNVSVSPENLILDINTLDSSIATHNLYKGSNITVEDVTTLDEKDRVIKVSYPVKVNNTIANTVKTGDLVGIGVTFEKDETNPRGDEIVVPLVSISDVRGTNGAVITDQASVVEHLIYYLTPEEAADINAAMKEGTLYLFEYKNLFSEPLEKTYRRPAGASSTVSEEPKKEDKKDSN